jgi:hypothetical protein
LEWCSLHHPPRQFCAARSRSCHARSRQQQCPVHTNIQVPVVMGQIRISWAGRYVAA